MQAAFKVLTDRMVLPYITGFLPGLPYVLLQIEPVVYQNEIAGDRYPSRRVARGASLLHHALLTDNTRLVELLMRLHEQPFYAAMPHFAIDGVLEMVCKRGSVRHLQLLHERPDIVTRWPSSLLRLTMDALGSDYPRRSLEDQAAFTDDQKLKTEWLTTNHPEACTELVIVPKVLVPLRKHREFLLKLVAAGALDLAAFARVAGEYVGGALLEVLLQEHPRARGKLCR